MRRRTLAIALLPALLAPASAHGASLSLRPAIAPAGASVAVEGAGWRARTPVVVRPPGGAGLARLPVVTGGKVAGTLRIPRSFKPRTHPLQARAPGLAVDAALRVVPLTRDFGPREIALSTGLAFDVSRTVAFPSAPVRIDVRG